MAKIAGTCGLGYIVRGVIAQCRPTTTSTSSERTVTNGDMQSINGLANGSTMTTEGPTPVINNGTYHARNMILSFGLQIAWETLLKRQKTHNWEDQQQ